MRMFEHKNFDMIWHNYEIFDQITYGEIHEGRRKSPQVNQKAHRGSWDIGFLSSTMRIEATGARYGMKSESLNFETWAEIH